jgi:hypothetical protein
MSTPIKVFLDLEETIITNWNEALLINVGAIKDWLDSQPERPKTIQIHSFAIWDVKDKVHFVNSGMKSMIEKALDVEVMEWLSVEDMQRIVEGWSGFRFESRTDFMQLHGKHDSFIKVCLAREELCRCILIDDSVPNRTVTDHTRGLVIDLMPLTLLTDKPLDPWIHKM